MATVRKFNICVPRPKGDGQGVWWHRIGRAVENDKGQISLFFDSLPVPSQDDRGLQTKAVCFVDEGERDGANDEGVRKTTARGSSAKPTFKGGGGRRGDMDDEIPF